MNWADWYTDRVDVYRVVATKEGNLTRHDRTNILTGVPCRVFRERSHTLNFTQTAANVNQGLMLACDNSVDIQPGDELIIHRGGHDSRCFAGAANYYTEPFGAVIPGLAHQEIPLVEEERI